MPFSHSTYLSHSIIPCGPTYTELTASVIHGNQSFSLLPDKSQKCLIIYLTGRTAKSSTGLTRHLSAIHYRHCSYALSLTLPDLLSLLLRHGSHDFNQDIVDHLTNPFLTMEINQRGGNIKYPDDNTMFFEPLQLSLDLRFVPTKAV